MLALISLMVAELVSAAALRSPSLTRRSRTHSRVMMSTIANSEKIAVKLQKICILCPISGNAWSAAGMCETARRRLSSAWSRYRHNPLMELTRAYWTHPWRKSGTAFTASDEERGRQMSAHPL